MTLKERREQKKLTKRELAAALGVSAPLVSLWESGARTVTLAHTLALAKFYKVEPLKFIMELHGDKLGK